MWYRKITKEVHRSEVKLSDRWWFPVTVEDATHAWYDDHEGWTTLPEAVATARMGRSDLRDRVAKIVD